MNRVTLLGDRSLPEKSEAEAALERTSIRGTRFSIDPNVNVIK